MLTNCEALTGITVAFLNAVVVVGLPAALVTGWANVIVPAVEDVAV